MATRNHGAGEAFSQQPYVLPPADYGTAPHIAERRHNEQSRGSSHYPFSTFPDTFNGVQQTAIANDGKHPPEPPIDYERERAPSPPHLQMHDSSVPLPDYNSPKLKHRIFGSGSPNGPNDFYSQHRSIAVPVLPPMAPSALDREPGKVGAGQNRAWLHHLKNHRKFDTLNSFRSVDDCPICQAMDSADIALTMRHRNRRQNYDSPIMSGKIYQSPAQRPILEESEVDYTQTIYGDKEALFQQKLNTAGVKVARVVQDRVARKRDELTVLQGELLEIVDSKKNWWSCCNMSGEVGWVPASDLQVIKTN